MRRFALALAVVLAAATALLLPPNAAAARGLQLGFHDDDAFTGPSDPESALALQHARDAGATVARFFVYWNTVAVSGTPPADLAAAADPAWPGYDWTRTDRTVRRMASAGIEPIAAVHRAPAWAEGSGRPAVSLDAPAGTWRPSPEHFGAFATALARRYSGAYPDPLRPGQPLPAVRRWQGWNEPNLSTYLSPQWRRAASGHAAESPRLYRALINAFYRAIKDVDRRNLVISASTAPYGDPQPGGRRIQPLRFYRSLLCLRGGARLRATRCGTSVWFDVVAHNPYPIGGPLRRALNADDMAIPDLHKLDRPLAVARRARTLRPATRKPVWVSEVSWDSAPDPDGLSQAQQARNLAGAFYVLWRQGVDLVTWWLLRDDAPVPSYSASYQSGIFTRGATVGQDLPKPSFTAFSFPFTAYRSGGAARLWGLAPAGQRAVVIERRSRGRWVIVRRLRAGGNRVFVGRLQVRGSALLRARTGTGTSVSWRVG